MTTPTPEQMRALAEEADGMAGTSDYPWAIVLREQAAALRTVLADVDRLRVENTEQRSLLFHYANGKEQEVQRLRAVIERLRMEGIPDPCTCWKATAL